LWDGSWERTTLASTWGKSRLVVFWQGHQGLCVDNLLRIGTEAVIVSRNTGGVKRW